MFKLTKHLSSKVVDNQSALATVAVCGVALGQCRLLGGTPLFQSLPVSALLTSQPSTLTALETQKGNQKTKPKTNKTLNIINQPNHPNTNLTQPKDQTKTKQKKNLPRSTQNQPLLTLPSPLLPSSLRAPTSLRRNGRGTCFAGPRRKAGEVGGAVEEFRFF